MSNASADSDYVGPATLTISDRAITVDADLRGHFQPIDGIFRWYGRLRPNDELDELVGSRKATGTIRTPSGDAPVTVGDRDPWGRYRVQGHSHPPYHVPSTIEEAEAIARTTRGQH